MLLYSKKIIKFIDNIKAILKDVLSREIGLKVFGDRFYDRREEYSYPIKTVIFNNQTMLGYFDPHFYELGFHECLMHSNREQLQNIIRHELAHYITFINYGDTVAPHGDEFRAFCKRIGWNEEVHKATTCLDDGICLAQAEENSVLRKVQKLMALATSSNKHEAEQAMIKSQQLLLKHNIDLNNIENDEDEKIFLKRIMKQTKKNAKMRSIAQILETFFVNTVYNRREGFTYLEVVGNATNVEIAEYVANTLEHKLDTLWDQTKKQQTGLKGTIAKNSFFIGVAKGYCNKINFLKRQYDCNTSHALILIEKKLKDAEAMVYQRLSKSSSHASYCSKSSWLGEQAGRELNINPAVNNYPNNSDTYLSFQT
jgi:hypothetical protein